MALKSLALEANATAEPVAPSAEAPKRGDAMFVSSFNVYDTRAAATNAVNAISARKGGEPVTVGVFYDPFAYVPEDWKPSDASADYADFAPVREYDRSRSCTSPL